MKVMNKIVAFGAAVTGSVGSAFAATTIPEYNATDNTFGDIGGIIEDVASLLWEYAPMLIILGIFMTVLYLLKDTLVSLFEGLIKFFKKSK